MSRKGKIVNHKLQDQLVKEFPFMVARNIWTSEICLDENGDVYGHPCECNDGWYDLIYNCCKEIEELYKNKNININKQIRCWKHANRNFINRLYKRIKYQIYYLFQALRYIIKQLIKNKKITYNTRLIFLLIYRQWECIINISTLPISIHQIKEKWGKLCIYLTGIDGVHDITHKYEKLSETTCEMCGENGEIRNIKGWYKCTCDDCYEKLIK